METHSSPGRWLPTLYPLWGGKHLSASTYGTTPYHSPPYGVNYSHPVDGVVFRGRIQPNFVLLVIIAGSSISNITVSTTGTGYINYRNRMHSPWEGIMGRSWIMDEHPSEEIPMWFGSNISWFIRCPANFVIKLNHKMLGV